MNEVVVLRYCKACGGLTRHRMITSTFLRALLKCKKCGGLVTVEFEVGKDRFEKLRA